jgi:uncharacterized membrane protein YphA (DoxX/SURF4 family)
MPTILAGLAITAGILLVAGLWTPISGALVAVFGFWNAVFSTWRSVEKLFVGDYWRLGTDWTWCVVG